MLLPRAIVWNVYEVCFMRNKLWILKLWEVGHYMVISDWLTGIPVSQRSLDSGLILLHGHEGCHDILNFNFVPFVNMILHLSNFEISYLCHREVEGLFILFLFLFIYLFCKMCSAVFKKRRSNILVGRPRGFLWKPLWGIFVKIHRRFHKYPVKDFHEKTQTNHWRKFHQNRSEGFCKSPQGFSGKSWEFGGKQRDSILNAFWGTLLGPMIT